MVRKSAVWLRVTPHNDINRVCSSSLTAPERVVFPRRSARRAARRPAYGGGCGAAARGRRHFVFLQI